MGIASEKEALYSQPKALVLSVKAKIFSLLSEFLRINSMVIADAINSSKLIENFPCKCSGIFHLHANPFMQ